MTQQTETLGQAMKNWGGWIRVVFALLGFSIFWTWQVSAYTSKTETSLSLLTLKLDSTNSDLGKIASATQTAIQQLGLQQTQLAVEAQKNVAQDSELRDLRDSLRDTARALDRLRDLQMGKMK